MISTSRRKHWTGTSLKGLAVSSAILAVALGSTGCQKPQNTISDLDPYAGKKPEPIAQLPQHEEVPQQQTHKRPTGGQPGWMPPGGITNKWECVVIHHSDSDKSTPQGIDSWHRQRGWDCIGYDFVIGNGVGYPDGEVYVSPRWTKQMTGAHCKVPGNFYNEHGVGICLVGDLDKHAPTKRQMQSLAKLVTFLTSKCGIPISKVLTHGGVTHKTRCPGQYFNLASLQRQLSAVSMGDEEEE